MSSFRLYDTSRRAIVPFEPNQHILMYTCGITPYDATHLGHAATFIAYDVLQRHLIDKGHTINVLQRDAKSGSYHLATSLSFHR